MRKSKILLTVLAAGLAASSPALAKDPLRIGVPTSLTGPYVELGEEAKRGALFAAAEANAKGVWPAAR